MLVQEHAAGAKHEPGLDPCSPTAVAGSGSGCGKAGGNAGAGGCGIESNTDLAGNDMAGGGGDVASAEECCARCANTTGCNFFTFRFKSASYPLFCWLKTSDAGKHTTGCSDPHVSGKPGGGPPGPPAPPCPPSPPPPPPAPPAPPHSWGPAPAKFNSLFVDGGRMQRARFPNGNADAASGLCFSATNRPGTVQSKQNPPPLLLAACRRFNTRLPPKKKLFSVVYSTSTDHSSRHVHLQHQLQPH